MRMTLPALAAVGFGLLTSGCGGDDPANAAPAAVDRADPPASEVTIGKNRDGGHAPLKLGQTLTVRLPGDPGTGYGWTVQKVDEKVLAPDGDVRFIPAGAPKPGNGGVFVARFRTVRPGQTWLKLIYRRPFEPTKPPADTFAVHVMVEPMS